MKSDRLSFTRLTLTREVAMNRYLLLWMIAIVLLATAGCPPRHPPHTPQPFGTKGEASGSLFLEEPRS
jgi:hypothetical protein